MSTLRPPVNGHDHFEGPENAPIELVEYGDYECPHCGRAYPVIKNIQQHLGNKLKFVFRNFPLAEAHPHATHAAIAAEAAYAQNKFWQMHDIVFEHQRSLDDVALVKYATQIGLNVEQFKADFEKAQYQQKVEADFESGIRSGVNGTPSFFVNGQKYDGDWDEETLLAYLKEQV